MSERAWSDWSDTRERVAMALLLQEVRLRGWGDSAELDEVLEQNLEFVDEHVVAADGTVADDSQRPARTRLYNFPWYALLMINRHRLGGDADHLRRAVAVVDRYYALGGADFLAFGLGPILAHLAGALEAEGDPAGAQQMREHLLGHARTFIAVAEDLPGHEVNYEQSMVAPLLDLLLSAHRLDPVAVPAPEVTRRLGWLTAFAADQPDARMQHVPIRHWDGYWFGALRLWGDVFPHHWSVLSAAVLAGWPRELSGSDESHDRLGSAAAAIMRSNLTAFFVDGSATCAFVYPSCVNGQPAHVADPLANDQDWALVYALDPVLGASGLV